MRPRRFAAVVALIAIGAIAPSRGSTQSRAEPSFAQSIASLSERGGYFDTDNMISNESSYLQVLPALRQKTTSGGAYIGVGPDQNFTYIAETRPAIAYIIDIRRDNLLLHLLFKALFTESRTRVEYLARLFGRPPPPDIGPWRAASIDRLARYIDDTRPGDLAALRARVDKT